MAEFLAMGGYGFYVWTSIAVFFLVLRFRGRFLTHAASILRKPRAAQARFTLRT